MFVASLEQSQASFFEFIIIMDFLAKKNLQKPTKLTIPGRLMSKETQKLTQGRTMRLPQYGDVFIDTKMVLKWLLCLVSPPLLGYETHD